MFEAMDISASGLYAQRMRMDSIANNIANVGTTRDARGVTRPYTRERVLFEVGMAGGKNKEGVRVAAITKDDPDSTPGAEPFRLKYEPGHPDANSKGYVRYPNVDLTREFVNALEASRAYEANIQAMEVAKNMNSQIIRLIQ